VLTGNREHKGIADNGRIAVELQTGLQQVVAEIAARSGPVMLDHKKVEVQSVLAVGCNKPLIERQLRRRGRPVAVGVLRENALQVPVQKVPDFLFVVHYLLKSLHYRSISRNDSALPGRG